MKPGYPAAHGNDVVAGFRWVKPAASLKRNRKPRGLGLGDQRFRWVKPAASLKRLNTITGWFCMAGMFPLGKTGGLIEAG